MAQLTISDYKNNLFSNHFLQERIQETDEWKETEVEDKFDELKDIYDKNKGFLSEDLNEDQTQQRFIDPVLKSLGHDWTPEARRKVGSRTDGKTLNPDYAFLGFEKQLEVNEDDERDYFDASYAIGDAKAWNRTLDKSSQDHTNPAFQIYNYVDRLRADWGVLTNGKKWRLYSYEDCAADIYFEVDLENLLAGEKTEEKLEAFKYFYLFFRAESFEDDFLEKVHQKSVEYNEGLEEDLEDKVYSALEVAVEGFFETNDIEKTEENIDLVHHSSLIFLYRVLFILNAESRDLLPTDDKAYRQAFGLTQLKRMIVEEDEENPLFQDTTVAWDNRLSRLFEGIDEGYDLHETEIPAYNGGLFDEENGDENQFLAENKLYGSYIKEVLELLATRYDEEKEKRVIVDYKDLNIRHLGSVYEGLLEHQFKAADERKVLKSEEWQSFSESKKDWDDLDEEKRVEENHLYLTNESGERKATGSYYTPEYIVEYIVENTVGPKVEEKISEAEEKDKNILPKILELNVCDPAMGSGHFLTEATEFIAEHIVEHADMESQDIDENEDELNWAKRQVVQNCIYGVDINPLAVELGKLSLWIETMAEGKPLNFLDHHLKHGNSLIGSDFDEIFSHPTEDQKRLDSERFKFGNPQEIKESFQEQYLEIEQMPENTVEQIHEKEQAYKKFISNNTLYQQFQQLANIHTRQHFQKEANSSDYESFLINIGNPSNPFQDNKWYKNAQQDSEERNYFHWQLEFPKVFFGEQNGFDAVVGNPPWSAKLNKDARDFMRDRYPRVSGNLNTAVIFMDLSLEISEDQTGYIVPKSLCYSKSWKEIREIILGDLHQLIDAGMAFEDALVETNIVRYSKESGNSRLETGTISKDGVNSYEIDKEVFNDLGIFFTGIDKKNLEICLKMLRQQDKKLSDFLKIKRGKLLRSHTQDNGKVPIYRGKNLSQHRIGEPDRYLTENKFEEVKDDLDYLDSPKLMIQNIVAHIKTPTDHIELMSHYDQDGLLCNDTVSCGFEKNRSNLGSINAFMNSKLASWYSYRLVYAKAIRTMHFDNVHLSRIPFNENLSQDQRLADKSQELSELKEKSNSFNINIKDYLGNYSDGKTLGELYTPVEGLSDSVLSDTSADRDSLRIGSIEFEERNGQLILKASARYKPEDSENISEDELDRWGYFETDKVPVMKFSGSRESSGSRSEDNELRAHVDEKMRPLIEEFVVLAVDEAGGFANFRESATKTNSVVDRLEKLTLPKLEDVESGLEKFIENRKEAEELESEIQETDELIDAIVFDLYDLTEEEVETVLDSLDTEESEKASILEKFSDLED